MWAAERRRHRLTLHVSGRRRAEAAQEGPWEGPPATQLVFIGTDATAMARLRDAFIAEVVQGAGPGSAAQRPAGQAGDGGSGAGKGSCEAQGESTPGVLEEWIREHERLVLVETLHPPSSAARGVGGGGGGDDAVASSAHTGARELWPGGSTVVFSARGSPLHGISPEEVNQDIALRANAAGGLLLVAVTAPGQVSAATLVQRRDRCVGPWCVMSLPVAWVRPASYTRVHRSCPEPTMSTARTVPSSYQPELPVTGFLQHRFALRVMHA